MINVDICYLCGSPLLRETEEIDVDHIPPKQIYPRDFRKESNASKLFTLPVHHICNKAYQSDEDYFVNSIGILAQDSQAGNKLWKDLIRQYKRPEGKRLGQMILKEFDKRPSGLYLPPGLIAKRFDPQRVWRIIWKITRGLFFQAYGRILPKDTLRIYEIMYGEKAPDPPFDAVIATSSRGLYPEVFDYKYLAVPEAHNFHLWAMLFWERIIMLIGFHDPSCSCEDCLESMKAAGSKLNYTL